MYGDKDKKIIDYQVRISCDNDGYDSPLYSEEKLHEVLNEIAKNIIRECERNGISLKELSEVSGVHYTHLYKISNGTGHIGLPSLIKISYALKISPDRFFPFEVMHRKTNGEKFDELTRDLEVEDCNFLIKFVNDYANQCRRIKFNARKNSK